MSNTYLPASPVAPMFLLISAITNANPAVVTVTTPNTYVVNQLVTFSVPQDYGMYQINQLTVPIVSVDPTNLILTMALNTTNFDPFVAPAMYKEAPASISSGGSRNLYNNTTVPFHSVGNTGN